jgi:hypothetical protein
LQLETNVLTKCEEEVIMREEKTKVEAPSKVKKAYVKPTATKHAAASQIVGSACNAYASGDNGCVLTGYYYH